MGVSARLSTYPEYLHIRPAPATSSSEDFNMFCHHCDDSLAGHRYVLRDDHPYCIKCYEDVFAKNCDECGKIIGIDSKDLSYKEKHWHEACFLCNKCRTSLWTNSLGPKLTEYTVVPAMMHSSPPAVMDAETCSRPE